MMRIDKEIWYHLHCLKRAFDSDQLIRNVMKNVDDTQFGSYVDSVMTLGFMEDEVSSMWTLFQVVSQSQ